MASRAWGCVYWLVRVWEVAAPPAVTDPAVKLRPGPTCSIPQQTQVPWPSRAHGPFAGVGAGAGSPWCAVSHTPVTLPSSTSVCCEQAAPGVAFASSLQPCAVAGRGRRLTRAARTTHRCVHSAVLEKPAWERVLKDKETPACWSAHHLAWEAVCLPVGARCCLGCFPLFLSHERSVPCPVWPFTCNFSSKPRPLKFQQSYILS